MTTADTRAAVVEALRAQIATAERGGRKCSRAPAVPFGIAAIDRHLPAGGLPLGAVHELQASGLDVEVGAAPALFAAGVLARRPGAVVWIGRSGGVFAHGLLQAGLDPHRVVFVDAGKGVLLAMVLSAFALSSTLAIRRRGRVRQPWRAGGPARVLYYWSGAGT